MSGLGARVVERLARGAGHIVELFDFPAHVRKPTRIPLPEALAHIQPHMLPGETGRLAFFTRYQRLGPPAAQCAADIRTVVPDVVLISSFAFCYLDQAAELAAACREAMPGVPIIAGGPGPAVMPEYLLRNRSVDACVTGEAESVLPQLLDAVERGRPLGCVPGVVTPDGGVGVGRPADPVASWHVAPRGRGGGHLVSLCLTRGCPRRCSFCSVHLVHGHRFRVLSLPEVRRLAQALPEDGTLEVNLEDDNLLSDWRYTQEALTIIRQERPGVTFRADNGLDYQLLSPDRVTRLAELGMCRFNLSMAVSNPAVAAAQQREVDLPGIRRVVEQVDRMGFPSVTYLICGLPGDTPESVAEGLAFAAGLPGLVGVSLFYPVPGLPGFTDPAVFQVGSPRLAAGSAAYPWTGALSTAELVTAFRLARLSNLRKEAHPNAAEEEALDRSFRSRQLHTVLRRDGRRAVAPVPHTSTEMQRVFFGLAE
jgi:hypothetical protein